LQRVRSFAWLSGWHQPFCTSHFALCILPCPPPSGTRHEVATSFSRGRKPTDTMAMKRQPRKGRQQPQRYRSSWSMPRFLCRPCGARRENWPDFRGLTPTALRYRHCVAAPLLRCLRVVAKVARLRKRDATTAIPVRSGRIGRCQRAECDPADRRWFERGNPVWSVAAPTP
jgi:hypothetical protein